MKLADINLLRIGDTIQLAGAVWAGEGKLLLCLFPGEDVVGLVPLELEMNVEDWAKFLRQTDLLETEILTRAENGDLVKAIYRKSQRQVDTAVTWKVFKRDQYRCRYCAADDVPLTIDHLVCWEDGGPSTIPNLLAACKKCNKTRGNTLYEAWLGHPYYKDVSRRLPAETHAANLALVSTLGGIPRVLHPRSR